MNKFLQFKSLNKTSSSILKTTLLSLSIFFSNTLFAANDLTTKYNLREPASVMAADLHIVHWVLMGICLVIFVVVFGFMFYSIYAHRKSKGFKPADFHESTTIEIAWTAIPLLIVIGIGIYATPLVMAQKDTTNADITIKVTGYQWKWGYEYLRGEGEGIKFYQTLVTPYDQRINKSPKTNNYLVEVDNALVVPVDKKVRVVITANDVIHAWSVPAVGVKQDAIPGFVRDSWFKATKIGTYTGQCSELCGKDHAFMPITLKVVSADDYSSWVSTQKDGIASNEVYNIDPKNDVLSKLSTDVDQQGGL
ncbi:MAG: cytochrome c oxidase subunit II [Betaproteobacteria bacterium TMED156]|nr:MAG: cytochrome c oxidase subunit II [Betaproteobacteria bacterium TMED156]